MKYIIRFIIIVVLCAEALAVREPRPTAIDNRIKVMVYSPDDILKFTGYYGYQTTIELAKDEEVISVSMGDTTGWQIVPAGHRIFIKPIENDATTNMTLITNKRTYFFELYAQEAKDIHDPNIAFNLRFIYPDEVEEDSVKSYGNTGEPDLTKPEKYNFNYSISGNEDIAPIKIFDDGEFTYLQFRGANAEMPAIFSVNDDLRESMVNYRVSTSNNNMIIVEHVYRKLAIKLGSKKVVCVFNESYRQ